MTDILEEKAERFATEKHDAIGHRYAGFPYTYHLKLVRKFAKKFMYHIPPEDRDLVFAGCWVHDTIEDALQTYNDVKEACGEEVADLAYALTNEKGKNRKQRASDKYYDEMRLVKYATFIKLCDRLANVYHSLDSQTKRMNKMYAEEHLVFKLLVSEVEVSNLMDRFLKWLFRRSSTRKGHARDYYAWVDVKYQDMWEELETYYVETFI